ncbi:MAG: serine protease AprX [Actinomycetota bacterium]|jgi:serine protease AprX|nr:serine protease AprX [Actinomycetota bacterium]
MPVVARRSGASMTLLALLGATSLTAVAPGGPVQQAVVAYAGGGVSVPGISVVHELAAIREAVVRGTPVALARLAHAPGVLGVFPDDRVILSGKDGGSGGGVAATEGLGGSAGKKDAGRGVTVAVVDTGVADTAALSRASGRLVDGVDTSPLTSGGAPVTSGRFDDAHGHGTFMASLVAGGPVDGTNNKAVGVAPAATVVVVKVADASGNTSLSSVVAGLDWVTAHAETVDVANLSFSHTRSRDGYGTDPLNAAVERLAAAGVVPVVSAGNTADEVGDPGFDPRALTVGAADLKGKKPAVASFSGSAVVAGVQKPDLVANGVSVLGVLPADSVVATQNPAAHAIGALWRGTGTSQSTAIVSGAAALLLQARPSATPAQVKASLRTSARDLPGVRDGQGLLDPTDKLVSGPDGAALDGSGDLTGQGSFDASSWSASSWSASSWSASSWSASSWSGATWNGSSWSASSWSASSWSASSWSASSWSAASWPAS